MASFFSAPLRFFNSSHTHISSFEITFLERRNILFIGEPGISVSFPTSLFKPKNTETLLFLRLLIDKFAYLRDCVLFTKSKCTNCEKRLKSADFIHFD